MLGSAAACSGGQRRLTSALSCLSIAVILAASLVAGCGGKTTATLSDLGGIEQLKTRFNSDAGRSRIVLLLSPT